MNSDQIWAVIDTERAGLADVLETLTMRFSMRPARRLEGMRLVATGRLQPPE